MNDIVGLLLVIAVLVFVVAAGIGVGVICLIGLLQGARDGFPPPKLRSGGV
jgi:hypothetical protein